MLGVHMIGRAPSWAEATLACGSSDGRRAHPNHSRASDVSEAVAEARTRHTATRFTCGLWKKPLCAARGESVAEGTIVRWLKKVGDAVERDEPLFEISTDKVDAEIPSPSAGVLSEIKVQEGQTVPINTVVAVVDESGAAAKPVAAKPTEAKPTEAKPTQAKPKVEVASAETPEPIKAPSPPLTPAQLPCSSSRSSNHLRRLKHLQRLRAIVVSLGRRRKTVRCAGHRSCERSRASIKSTSATSPAAAPVAGSRDRTSLPISRQALPPPRPPSLARVQTSFGETGPLRLWHPSHCWRPIRRRQLALLLTSSNVRRCRSCAGRSPSTW